MKKNGWICFTKKYGQRCHKRFFIRDSFCSYIAAINLSFLEQASRTLFIPANPGLVMAARRAGNMGGQEAKVEASFNGRHKLGRNWLHNLSTEIPFI